jgi:hypothetical protein
MKSTRSKVRVHGTGLKRGKLVQETERYFEQAGTSTTSAPIEGMAFHRWARCDKVAVRFYTAIFHVGV